MPGTIEVLQNFVARISKRHWWGMPMFLVASRLEVKCVRMLLDEETCKLTLARQNKEMKDRVFPLEKALGESQEQVAALELETFAANKAVLELKDRVAALRIVIANIHFLTKE